MNKSLETAVQVLTLSSSILAIVIESTILIGGVILVKKYILTDTSSETTALVPIEIVQQKPTLADNINKIKSIWRAIVK